MIGRQVSHFRVQSLIGQGGMGEVYLARDLSLDRSVALKFVTGADAADPDAARRLVREAHAIASLDHPFICKVYEAGESDGRPYLAMEYVDGQTLQARLAAGPLPVHEAVRLAIEIAEAMECAHVRGIIHRDLKPSNVMVAVDGHVKVMDFGIAKRAELAGSVDQTTRMTLERTAPGVITGSLAYSSPEQLRGMPVDTRSDIFAFGILLYEMLAGAHPFKRESAIDMVDGMLNAAPPPLTRPGSDVPAALERIVLGCLEKDRERRWASFQDVRSELQSPGSRSGQPGAGRVPPRRRRLAVAAALLAAAVVGALIWFDRGWLHLSEPALAFNARDWIIITDCDNLTGDDVFDRTLALALDVGIGQSNYVNVYSRDRLQTTLQRMRKPAAARLDLALASEVAQRDSVRAVLTCSIDKVGDVYSIAGRIVDPLTQRIALTESVQANGRGSVLPALDQLAGRLRRRLGESLATLSTQSVALPQATTSSLEALKLFTNSLRLGRQSDADTAKRMLLEAIRLDPDFAMAHAVLGRLYFFAAEPGPRQEGERHIARALSLSNRLTTRERLLIQASADDARGNREQAAVGYRTYLTQYPDDTRIWFSLGWTYMAGLSQFQNGIDAFNHLLAIDPKDSSALINLATCYVGLRQYDRAVETYGKAFALNPEEMLGVFVNGEYGSALMHVGRADEAEKVFTRMTASPGGRARGLRSLAFFNMYRGRYKAAVTMLREAIALNQSTGANTSVYRDRMIMVHALLAAGALADARRELAQVNAMIAKQTFGPEWLGRLAKVQARLGDLREAERVVAFMSRSVGDATASSASNRNVDRDQGFVELARAEIDIARRQPDKALAPAAAAAARLQYTGIETAALAAAAAGRDDEAAARYAELVSRPTFVLEEQEEWFNAHLALGRLYERLGRAAEARQLYERVAQLWKDGDTDLVLLKAVRARLAVLPH